MSMFARFAAGAARQLGRTARSQAMGRAAFPVTVPGVFARQLSKSAGSRRAYSSLYTAPRLPHQRVSGCARTGVRRRNFSQEAEGAAKKKPQYGNDPNSSALQRHVVATKVRAGISNTFIAGLALLGLTCAGLIIYELAPSKMSPNNVFDRGFDRLRKETAISNYFGADFKAYGRDRSRGAAGLSRVEGRRNFIDHVEYDDEEGVQHTRIMFNIEGKNRKGVVYADVSKDMDSGDFYYLIVQDRQNPKRKWAIVDNRPQTPHAVRQEEIAHHLVKHGVILYGSNREPNTVKQLEKFGEACKILTYIDCHKLPEECAAAHIEALPTWRFKGVNEVGVRETEDLFTRATKRDTRVFKNMA